MFNSESFDYDYEIFGCAYGCPLQNRNQDCPFMEIDQLKFIEKVDWVEDLNNGKKGVIVEHHLTCIRNRELKLKKLV